MKKPEDNKRIKFKIQEIILKSMDPEKTITLEVDKDFTLIEFLLDKGFWIHPSVWEELINNYDKKYIGRISINNSKIIEKKRITDKLELKKKDVFEVIFPNVLEPKVPLNYEVVFEDEFMLIVNKPAGLPVNPGGRFYSNTLKYQLRFSGNKDWLNVEAMHRLDKETSGLVIFSKTKEAKKKLGFMFNEKLIKKKYQAIVRGELILEKNKNNETKKRVINLPLEVKESVFLSKKAFVCEKISGKGKKAITIIEDSKVFEKEKEKKEENKDENKKNKYSLLTTRLETGKFHQIRCHLASIGYPIVGDKNYINEELFDKYFKANYDLENNEKNKLLGEEILKKTGANRQLLHAYSLEFKHPFSREIMKIKIDLPKDMKEFIEN